jgi:hypothetical protein
VFVYSLAVFVCLFLVGCQPSTESNANWLLVSFEENVPVTYRFKSARTTQIDLTGGDETKKKRPQTMKESIEMVITYLPIEVDPFGLTTIEATCESVKVSRSSMSGRTAARDAMEQMKGKTFTFQLSPTGQIAEYTDMERLLREIGAKAFDTSKKSQRIKNPDMTSDFIAMQWYLWDSVATIEEPLDGLATGNSWQASQFIPWSVPIPNPPARLTTYTLDSFENVVDQPQRAVIKSSYEVTKLSLDQYPKPYEGAFQMRGLMGFLRGYQFQSLEGSGTQTFNMDNGHIESDKQQYKLIVNASFMLPLGDSLPLLTIDQTIEINKIETP